MPLRRARGMLLRFVRRRVSAIVVGVALVLGATGMAILWTGLTGAASDWVDPEEF